MKIVFRIIFALAALAAEAAPAAADQVYFNTRDLLTDFFRKSEAVSYKKLVVGADERARLARRLGYAPAKESYTFFVARTGAHVDGYALIDEERGEHQPITFAVKLSPAGKVERQEIVVYREPRGDEVRDEQFRRQFVGKGANDPLDPSQDIVVVSGATISSRAIAVGVKRALVLFDELMRPAEVASATR